MPLRSLPFTSLWVALLLSLSGCASWFEGDSTAPQVHLVKVDLLRARLLEQHFMLSFRVDNPSEEHLRVRGLVYRIHLADMLLTEGEADEWFVVKPHGSKFFTVPVQTNLWQHLKGIAKLVRKRSDPVPYHLEGELKTGLVYGEVHVERNGEIIPSDFIPERKP